MASVNNTVLIVYMLGGRVSRRILVYYGITKRLSKAVGIRYTISNRNKIARTITALYTLTDQTVVQHTLSASVKIGTAEIEVIALTIQCDEGSYCYTCVATILNEKSWLLCAKDSVLDVVINGMEYSFVIDTTGRQRSFGETVYTLQARSKTKALDFPAATAMSFTNTSTTAYDLCLEICTAYGFALDWRILNWEIPADRLTVEGESPLNILRTVASAAGGILQSSPDGETLIVQYKYTSGVNETVFDDCLNILSWEENLDQRSGYNCVRVSDKDMVNDDNAEYIHIELDSIRNNGKTSFSISDIIYFRVYSNAAYTMKVTAGSISKVATGAITDEEPEIVLFDADESPNLNKPITSIDDTTWYGNNLGAVSIVSASEIEAAGANEYTLGIAKITYKAAYDIWRLVPPHEQTGEFYIYVQSIQDEADL